MKRKRIVRSFAPHSAVDTLRLMSAAVRCIRRTRTACARLEKLAAAGLCTASKVALEVRRQHAEDMPVRRRLAENAEGMGWDAVGLSAETREALMTLLMALVTLDDRTEIMYERIRKGNMKRKDCVAGVLFTSVLYVCGALSALLAVGCGWDVSGCDALLKGGVAFGAFLALVLLGSAVWQTVLWVRIRRVNRLRVLNARVRGVAFDGVEYTDYRDTPRFRRRVVRREMRRGGFLSDGVNEYVGGPESRS